MISLPGIQAVRKLAANPLLLGLRHRRFNRIGDAPGDLS